MTGAAKVTGFPGIWESDDCYYAPQHAQGFRMVTTVADLPRMAAVNVPLTLSGTVVPADATRRNIVWSIVDAEMTGVTLSGNTLTATETGTVTVSAGITGGYASGKDFEKEFEIKFK